MEVRVNDIEIDEFQLTFATEQRTFGSARVGRLRSWTLIVRNFAGYPFDDLPRTHETVSVVLDYGDGVTVVGDARLAELRQDAFGEIEMTLHGDGALTPRIEAPVIIPS